MAHFFKSGNVYRVAPGDALDIQETLPAGNYVLKFSPMEGFWLETSAAFKMPSKIYGDCLRNSSRILNTFRQREGNTGALLVGEKGSGKTLLARQISIESEMPVILINSEHFGDNFNSFLSSITQPTVVLFDEFEKVYSKEGQEKILTLLDGTYQSQKLFLLTSNDKWNLNANMKNRPGRIFYLLEFSGLDESFIREYCEDRLHNQSKISDIVQVSGMFDQFNFDLLSSFVEEVNRYGENPIDLVRILNAKPEYSGKVGYSAIISIGDRILPKESLGSNELYLNTTVDEFTVEANFVWRTEDDPSGNISNALGHGHIDADQIGEWLDKGLIHPGRKSIWPEGVDWNRDYIYVKCEADEIVRYESTSSILYKNEAGFLVRIVKSGKKRRKGGYID